MQRLLVDIIENNKQFDTGSAKYVQLKGCWNSMIVRERV